MAEKNSLWKNIRKKAEQNRRTGATPKKPTAEMLRQERKIKAKKYAEGGETDPPYRPLSIPMEGYEPDSVLYETPFRYSEPELTPALTPKPVLTPKPEPEPFSQPEPKSKPKPVNKKEDKPKPTPKRSEVQNYYLNQTLNQNSSTLRPKYIADRSTTATKNTPDISTKEWQEGPRDFNIVKGIQVALDLGQMVPNPVIAGGSYLASLPFTTYDVLDDLSKDDYKQAAVDALGYIPKLKNVGSLNTVIDATSLYNDVTRKAQGGKLYAEGDSIDPPSGTRYITPTRQDSLMLYNNALDKIRFYSGNPDYRKTSSKTNFKDPKVRKNLIWDAFQVDPVVRSPLVEQIALNAASKQDALNSGVKPSKPMSADEKRKMQKQVGVKKFGKVAGTNLTSLGDVVSGQPDVYYNPLAPPIYLHPNISPQGSEAYISQRLNDLSDIPNYDPLAVAPWDTLNEKQKEERVKKYGTSGTPLASTSTRVTKPSIDKLQSKQYSNSGSNQQPGIVGNVENISPLEINMDNFYEGQYEKYRRSPYEDPMYRVQLPGQQMQIVPESEFKKLNDQYALKDLEQKANGGYMYDGGGNVKVGDDGTLLAPTLKEINVTDDATGWARIWQDEYNKRSGAQKTFQESWYSDQEYDPANIERRASIAADDAAAKYILDNHASRNDFTNRQEYLKSFNPYEREVIERSNYAGNFEPDMGSRFRRGLGLLTGTRSALTNPDSDLSAEDYANRNFFSNIGDIISPVTYPFNLVRGAVKGTGKSALKGETASPWLDATNMALGNEEDVWKYNLEGDIALDPLNFAGTGIGSAIRNLYDKSSKLNNIGKIGKYFKTKTPKQLPGSSTSNSIMRNSEGQIQFLDNEAYRDALVTGKGNIVNYLSDPRYKEVVEANQQLANRLNMNRVLPIQREMGNVGLHDARVAKIKQPITILDPRSLETKIIQGTNEGVQAQYSRNLDGSGFLNIPRVHDKATTIKNIEHEALHHVYPNLGEGYPSFTPLETAKAKSVFKPSSELRKIEETNNVPLWYLDDVDELVPNSFDLANDLGIEKFQKYPGIESFKKMLDSYSGGKKFIKEALKLNNKRDYKRAWDMLSGVRLGLVPPAAIIGTGVVGAGAMSDLNYAKGGPMQYKRGGLLKDIGLGVADFALSTIGGVTGIQSMKDIVNEKQYSNDKFDAGANFAGSIGSTALKLIPVTAPIANAAGIVGGAANKAFGIDAANYNPNQEVSDLEKAGNIVGQAGNVASMFMGNTSGVSEGAGKFMQGVDKINKFGQSPTGQLLNQGLSFEQGGNINNNSVNLQNSTMKRYKDYKTKYKQGGIIQDKLEANNIYEIPSYVGKHYQHPDGGMPIGPDASVEGEELVRMEQGGPTGVNTPTYVDPATVNGTDSIMMPQMTSDYKMITDKNGMPKFSDKSPAQWLKEKLSKRNSEFRVEVDRFSEPSNQQVMDIAEGGREVAVSVNDLKQQAAQEDAMRIAMADNVAAYGGYLSKYRNLNMPKSKAKGGYAVGGPLYGNTDLEYTYAHGGPVVSNVPQDFDLYAQNRGGMMMADGGMMMPQDDGMSKQIAAALQQGADPQQLLQQLIDSGMNPKQAQAMLQAIMGNIQPQAPMMAMGGRTPYGTEDNPGGDIPQYAGQLGKESWLTTAAGIGQVIPDVAAGIMSARALKKKDYEVKPFTVEGPKFNAEPIAIGIRGEAASNKALMADTLRNSGMTAAGLRGSLAGYFGDQAKAVGKGLTDLFTQKYNIEGQGQFQADMFNAKARTDAATATVQGKEGYMQDILNAGQGVTNKLANYYANRQKAGVQQWQAENTKSPYYKYVTVDGKTQMLFMDEDGNYRDTSGNIVS